MVRVGIANALIVMDSTLSHEEAKHALLMCDMINLNEFEDIQHAMSVTRDMMVCVLTPDGVTLSTLSGVSKAWLHLSKIKWPVVHRPRGYK